MAAPLIKTLVLTLDGVDRSYEVTNARIVWRDTEAGVITFERARAGGAKTAFLEGTALVDPGDADSLWRLVADNSGDEVAVIVAPYGEAALSGTTPAWTGNVRLRKEGDTFQLGGEATVDDNEATFDFSFPFTSEPVMDTTA